MQARMLSVVAIVIFLAVLVVAVAVGGIYELRVDGLRAWRLNRFTGTVWLCGGLECRKFQETKESQEPRS